MTMPALLDPERIQPARLRILAVQYTRPKKVGNILLPESYDKDGSWNWWEAIKAGPGVAEKLGMELREGDIFRTPWRPAVDLGAEDARGRRLFIVACVVQVAVMEDGKPAKNSDGSPKLREEMNVTGILPKTWEDE